MRLIKYSVGAVLVLLFAAISLIYWVFHVSQPKISGQLARAKIAAVTTIERDSFGTPTIRARSRADLAFATGVAHAQDRFFQMDLMRRAAAGELAELLGSPVIDTDKRFRIHGFRRVA
jgi:penicillin amidase